MDSALHPPRPTRWSTGLRLRLLLLLACVATLVAAVLAESRFPAEEPGVQDFWTTTSSFLPESSEPREGRATAPVMQRP